MIFEQCPKDALHETVPARLPTATSFSSYSPAERDSYKPISPWVDQSSKYRNEVGDHNRTWNNGQINFTKLCIGNTLKI